MLNASTILPASKSDCYSGIMDVAMSVENLALKIDRFFLNSMFVNLENNTRWQICKLGHRLCMTIHRLATKIWYWAFYRRYPRAQDKLAVQAREYFATMSSDARSNRVKGE